MGQSPSMTIHVPGRLRTYCAGAAQLSISAHTVRAALEDLQQSQSALYRNVCDETGTVRRHLNVFVNSDNVRDLDGIDTTLRPGDVVTILPAGPGGWKRRIQSISLSAARRTCGAAWSRRLCSGAMTAAIRGTW